MFFPQFVPSSVRIARFARKLFVNLATLLRSAMEAACIESCPGYKASTVKYAGSGLSTDLTLAGASCNVYGTDLNSLRLIVSSETDREILSI